jgi:Na+/phosphate symporter
VSLALNLVPYAGIAFLWFIGVIRDRLADLEDRLFATVFLGSGLLFLALTFVGAALAGGLLSSYTIASDALVESGVFTYSRAVMYQILNVYAIRMAGVFMISLGTIWIRTGLMRRGWALLTYALALVLLVSIGYSLWVTLIFPGWVLAVSVYFLILNLRRPSQESMSEI